MDAGLVNYIIITLISLLVGYLVYLHRSIHSVSQYINKFYTKNEVEHIIDLKIKPTNDRTTMLEDRLERLERKIDRILDALGNRTGDN